MSDPMSNLEIQDVLSSIRRLISEDKRTIKRPGPARTYADAPKADEKLVLTQAHRVDAGPAEATSSAERAAGTSLEDTIAELEAAVAGIGGEFEPDGSEVIRALRGEADAELEAAFEDGFAVDLGAEPDGRESPLQHPVTSGSVDDGDGDRAEGATLPDESGNQEGDRSEEAAAEIGEDVAPADDREPETDGAASTTSPDGAAEPDDVPAGGTSDIPAIPAPETGAPRRLNLTASDLVPGGAPWDRADAAALEPEGATAPVADEADTAPLPDDEQTDAPALPDMQTLQDLVAEIVRQELKGPLGERMTRNIRLLVRREINRALDSRDTH